MKKRFRPVLLRAVFILPSCLALAFWPALWALWPAPAAAADYDVTGTVNSDVYGNGDPDYQTLPAFANPATNNSLTIKNGGVVTGEVYGGTASHPSANALAQGNRAAVESGGTAQGKLFGGDAYSFNGSATAQGNSAAIGGAAGNISGGYALSERGSATAQNNHASVGGNAVVAGNIIGGHAVADSGGAGLASGNTVTISGGTLTGNAFINGATAASASGAAMATGNTVSISGGILTPITLINGGAATGISGGDTTDNSILISGGTFGDVTIHGGFNNSEGNATGNIVIISGGTFGDASVYGGFSNGNSGNATGNIVTLSGTPDLAKSGIFGGGFRVAGPRDVFSGNTLHVKTPGLTVAKIGNFEHLNFYLPTTFAAGGVMLTVTESACLTENTDGTGRSSQVHVGIDGASSPLQVGDRVTLIDASAATGAGLVTNSGLNTTTIGEGMAGVTLRYEFGIAADTAGLLTATVTRAGANEQAKALAEGVIGGLSLAAQGGDAVAGQGMANAVSAAGGAATVAGFSAASGGSMRFNSGSHVDMDSVSLVAGLSWGKDFTPGRMTAGGFFEFGTGSYDTYNSFSNAATVYGKGDTYYWGGGVLGRMDFTNSGPGHFYAEGSLRAGKLYNEYKSDDLRDSLGRSASYDSDSIYYGLHFGSGYAWSITEAASLDFYAKYFWTHEEGDSVTLSTGDRVSFKDTDSHRLRGGARFTCAVNEHIAPYAGAAYEYEFDGKARATANGHNLPAPSLRGGTGIAEVGLTFKPSKDLPLSFDFGIQGYVGKREGVTGSLQFKFEF